MSQPEDIQSKEADSASASAEPISSTSSGQTPASGRRQAFDDVLRPLTDEDLKSPGTQKIILYMLQQAQAENEQLEGYVERFHEADKRATLLQQRCDSERKISKVIEIIVIAGTTLGGAVFGMAFYFWAKTPPDNISAIVALVISVALIAGAVAAKVAQR